jgi:TP901 family phage tail tape measure protein
MADSTSHIINYIGNITEVSSKVKELSRINKVAAEQMTKDFTSAVNIIDQQISKLAQKSIDVPVRDNAGKIVPGQLKKQITDTRQLTSIIENADGKLKKFVETQINVDNTWKSTTTSLTNYKAAINDTNVKQQEYLGTLTAVKKQLLDSQRINQQLTAAYGDAAKGASILNTTVSGFKTNTIVQDGQKLTETVRTYDTQIRLADGTTKTLKDTVRTVGGSVKSVTSSLTEGSVATKTFGENLAFILKRAALTIPVWFAIRQSLSSLFTTIRDGLTNLSEFDLSLQKVRRNLTGTPEEIEAQFRTLRTEITKLSLETGKSTEEIADAVKAFATIGFSFEDSLKGGIEATKLSILLFADAGETARTYARAIKILADTSSNAVSIQEQMNQAFALTAELEKTNQFELNEVIESLIKFAPTAKSAGLSLKETLVLLATLGTAGRTGSNAGTLLSSSVNQLRQNLDKLAGTLGVSVNPQFDTTFDIIGRVLDKASELQKVDSLGARQAEALADVFGGEKGTKTIASLVSLNDTFKENQKVVADAVRFNKDFLRVNDSLSNNVKKLNNQLKENGKAFVAALVGAEDYNQAVKNINTGLSNSRPALENVGTLLNSIFSQPLNLAGFLILPILIKQLFTKAIPAAIIASFATISGVIGGFITRIGAGIIGGVPGLIGVIGAVLAKAIPEGIIRGINRADQEAQIQFRKLIQGLQGKLATIELQQLIVDIKSGAVKLAPGVNKDVVVKQLEAQLDKNIEVEVQAKVDAKSIDFLSLGESQNLRKVIIQNQLEIAKSQGASTSELLKQESLLNKQFNIFEDEFTVLERQLATQRAITAEQRLQGKLGSDSIKLFEIAQKNGADAARAIGNVLSSDDSGDFARFVRQGGENLKLFQENFGDLFKQKQAEAFFKGESVPGIEGLRGGSNIAIQEEFIRKSIPQFNTQALINARQAEAQIPTIRNDIQARIQMNVDVKGLSFREAVDVMKAEMAREVLSPESPINKAVNQQIDNR